MLYLDFGTKKVLQPYLLTYLANKTLRFRYLLCQKKHQHWRTLNIEVDLKLLA